MLTASTAVRLAAPLIVGAAVYAGAPPSTVAVAALVELTVASGFVAVTTTRTFVPSSATPSV